MNQNLLKLLKQKKRYSWKQLKETLNIYNDEDLIKELFKIIDTGIEKFNIDSSPLEKHYIEKAIEFLNYHGINEIVYDNKEYISKIDSFIKDVHNIINKIEIKNRKYLHNQELLNRMLFSLKHTKKKFCKLHYNKRDFTDEVDKLFNYLVVCFDKINECKIYEELFFQNKDLINITNSDGYCLLDFVIDSYIKSLKNGEKNKIKYYQELLKKLLVHPTAKFSQDLKLMYIEELSFLCTKIKNSELPSQTKMEQLSNIEELVEVLSYNDKILKTYENYSNICEIYGVEKNYSKEYLEALNNLKLTETYKYQDHTTKNVITIDNANVNIFEDAFNIEKSEDQTKLYLYLPLLADYVDKKSKIKKYLIKQSSTIYSKRFVKHIIPSQILKEKFSLDEGKERPVFTIEVTVDKNFDVKSVDIYRSIINVKKNHTVPLSKATFKNFEEFNYLFNINKILATKLNRKKYESINSFLENYNLFCKKAVIEFCTKKNIPIIYKETTNKNLVKKFKVIQKEMNLVDNTYINNIIKIIENYKNKFKSYTLNQSTNIPLTSPLRECASFLNQQILLQELIDKDIKCYYKDLNKILEKLNDQERKNSMLIFKCNHARKRNLPKILKLSLTNNNKMIK